MRYRKPTFCDEETWKYAERDAKIMRDQHAKSNGVDNLRGVLCDPFGEHGTVYDRSVRASISHARHVLGA